MIQAAVQSADAAMDMDGVVQSPGDWVCVVMISKMLLLLLLLTVRHWNSQEEEGGKKESEQIMAHTLRQGTVACASARDTKRRTQAGKNKRHRLCWCDARKLLPVYSQGDRLVLVVSCSVRSGLQSLPLQRR